MIIAISGYEANIENRVGIGRYAYEIISGIYKLLSNRNLYKNIEVIIYLPTQAQIHLPEKTDYWRYQIAKPLPLWTFLGFPLSLSTTRPKPDIIFSPTHYIPRFTKLPQAFSIMDLSYEYYPELFNKNDLFKLKHWTSFSAQHAKCIFTISRFSKDAIIKTYGVSEKAVVVTYPGLSNQKSMNMTKNEIIQKYGISQNYVLSVGTIQPRKNYIRLIEAFKNFLLQNRQKYKNLELIIIGKKGWMYDEILASPKKFNIADKVKFLDYVPDSDLTFFYKYALSFVLPSLYEGFGLPALEAMAQECPVVVSKSSSLPEIVGSAGIYVDPESTEDITQGLLASVRERNLIQGKNRIKKGLLRVKEFSWEKAAKQTLDILIEIATN
jgi:glycosyltransferase involved in cell wall biosynthesis